MTQAALAGRRVLELGGYLAAPFAGRILAQLGADVVKVESLIGDATRNPQTPGNFISQNAGKRSLCLDIRAADGREVFDRLLGTSDVLVHNLAPDAVQHLRLTADDCQHVNPRIVYCGITGYGPGPLHGQSATNPAIEAATGVMFNNRVDGRPTRLELSYYDMAVGANAVIGVLAALMSTGDEMESRRVEVPLYETGLFLTSAPIVASQNLPAGGTPPAGRSEFARPGYGSYETADGRWMYLIMLTDEHWQKFCEALVPAENVDPLLASRDQRHARPKEAEAFVSGAVRTYSFDDAAERLRRNGFGFEEVRPLGTVLEHPQALHPGKLLSVLFNGRQYAVPSLPILSDSAQAHLETGAPLLGEHTLEILRSLGYDEAQRDAMVERKVVRVSARVGATP